MWCCTDRLSLPRPTSRKRSCDVRLYRDKSRNLAGGMVVRGARGLASRLLCLAALIAEYPGEGQRSAADEGAIQLPGQRPGPMEPGVSGTISWQTGSPAADIGSSG